MGISAQVKRKNAISNYRGKQVCKLPKVFPESSTWSIAGASEDIRLKQPRDLFIQMKILKTYVDILPTFHAITQFVAYNPNKEKNTDPFVTFWKMVSGFW